MIKSILNKLLYKYDSESFISKNRARFILYLILTLLIITPVLIIYFFYIHLYTLAYNFSTMIEIIIPASTAFILSLIMLIFLIKGYFSVSGNLLIIIWQSALWGIIFMAKEETLIRIDSIVLIAATLTMMPIIILKQTKLFILYTFANIAILFIFMYTTKNELNLSEAAFTDFLSVNTITFTFIGIVSYTIFSINSRALEKAENEITERKKAEEHTNRLQMQLLQSQKLESVGLLAGGVAHDFNNMLAAVQGYAELARENVEADTPARVEIDEIIKASKKARDLTRQLLAFARIQPLDIKKINLNRIISDFTGMLIRSLRGNIIIHNDLCKNPGSIEGDPVQIEQVILNLTLNSQDAMPDGGTIIIKTSRVTIDDIFLKKYEDISTGEYIMMSISDSGTGIDPAIIDKIFNPFFTTKDFGKGTGLGLSTVYGIVKQHNGFIKVSSEKSKGTVFSIYLPVNEIATAADSAPASGINSLKGSETILAVEDTPEVRNLLERVLTKNGYTTFIAENAESALSIALSYNKKIDLLITDVMMPDMNGVQLYNKISESRPDIKVIYISGYTANIIEQNGESDDRISFLQKPFAISDFTKKVRDLLDS